MIFLCQMLLLGHPVKSQELTIGLASCGSQVAFGKNCFFRTVRMKVALDWLQETMKRQNWKQWTQSALCRARGGENWKLFVVLFWCILLLFNKDIYVWWEWSSKEKKISAGGGRGGGVFYL